MSGSEGGTPARIVMSAALPGVEFTVVDGNFQQVARGIGRLSADLDSGIYEISTRAGGRVETELVALEPGETWSRQDISMEVFSAAPLTKSRTVLNGQAEEVAAWSRAIAKADGPDAGLVLVVRLVDPDSRERLRRDQVALLDEHGEPVPGAVWHERTEIGTAVMATRLPPGGYLLRVAQLDHSVWLAAGWQTLVFCPSESGADGHGRVDLDSASVHMKRLHEPFLPEAYEAGAAMEIALSGLRQGMPLVPDDLPRLLQGKNVNPMLGIVGAQALLLAAQPDLGLCREVTRVLLELLPDHPDVIALGRRLSNSSTLPSVRWPPMLAASYDALLAADRVDPDTIQDGSIAESVAGYVVRGGPWLSWEPAPAPTIVLPGATGPGGSSVATAGATRRVQRHVMEVAQLTGASPHQVAGSLGVDELARRLDLPVQTVRVVLDELGWSTLFVPTPSRGEEFIEPVPEGRSPFEPDWSLPDLPIAAAPVTPSGPVDPPWMRAPRPDPIAATQPPAAAAPGRRRWWLIALPLAILLIVIGGLVVLAANRDDDPVDRNTITSSRADLKLTIHGETRGRRITPYVQLLNLGPSPASPKLTIKIPTQFRLTGPVADCTGDQTLTCMLSVAPGGRVQVALPLTAARRSGSGRLIAGAVSDIEETNIADNSASIQLTATSRPPITTKPTTPHPTTTPPPTTTPIPTTPLPTTPLPTTPPG